MKIKTKKQLTLPQLIDEIVQNDIINTFAELKSEYPAKQGIQIDRGGRLHLVGMDYLSKNNTFIVEVEEEITEDTPLSMIVEIDEDSSCWVFENTTLKNIHETDCGTNTTKYYRDEDENMHIIWRDGKLVE